jgi:hypothetical protein
VAVGDGLRPPEGESEWRVLNTAVHDGRYLPSSTKTVTEWTFVRAER